MTFRFATSTIPPRERADAWRAVSSAQFVPLEPTPLGESRNFKAKLVADRFADCSWALITTTEHQVNRTPSTIRQASPGTMFVNLQLAGNGVLQQGSNTFAIRPGDVAVIDTDAPFTLNYPEKMRMACFCVPKMEYNLKSEPSVIAAENKHGSVLATYLRGLAFGGAKTSTHGKELARQLSGLLAKCSAAPVTQSMKVLTELRDLIAQRLDDPSLDSSELARALHISRSRLYELLAKEGATVHGLLVEARLQRAEQLLLEHRSIGDVAIAVGYADPGTFTRAFKKRHGMTPRAWGTCSFTT